MIGALQIAVVLKQQGDPLASFPGVSERLLRLIVLFAADRGGGYPASVLARGVESKGTSAGADFKHVVARRQLQLSADAVELLHLSLFERIARMPVDGA